MVEKETVNFTKLCLSDQYDLEHYSKVEDIPFWLDAAKTYGSPILEIGCGTGRATIPLLFNGFKIHCVDKSSAMLDGLKKNIAGAPKFVRENISIHESDMRSFNINKQFPLAICSFNTFLNLTNTVDQNKFLLLISKHLVREGVFILDIVNPGLGTLKPSKNWRLEKANYLPDGFVSKRYYRHLSQDLKNKIIRIQFKTTLFDRKSKIANEWFFTYTTTYHGKEEMFYLLKKGGFEVEDLYGDYDKTPYKDILNPPIQLIVSRKG